jgi:hypothetical protein
VVARAPADARTGLAALVAALAIGACAPPSSEADAGPTDRPQIVSVDPPDGSVDVPTNPILRFETTEHLDDTTVTGSEFKLYSGPLSMWLMAYYDPVSRRTTVWPSASLRENADWVFEGLDGITDREGDPLAPGRITWFTTGEQEGDDVPFPELRYDPDIRPILDAKCASCHGGENPTAGLALDSADGIVSTAMYVASVDRPSFELIVPARPGRSYLVYKILGDELISGLKMPCSLGGDAEAPALTQVELQATSDWIAGGAVMGP